MSPAATALYSNFSFKEYGIQGSGCEGSLRVRKNWSQIYPSSPIQLL